MIIRKAIPCTPLLLAVALSALAVSPALADNWPAWRGASGQGFCGETDLPLRWSRDENVRWKIDLPAPGNSTPVVWDDRVIITQATEGGAIRSTICYERSKGRKLWQRDVRYDKEEPTHNTNPYCSSSPVTDGERVIVSHGSAGVFCYSLEGEEQWRRDLGEFRHIWGNASSPVIAGERCFLNCGPGKRSFLIALDKRSGDTLWKRDIPGGLEGGDRDTWTGSWSTPLLLREDDRDSLLLSVPGRLVAHDPRDGEERWSCEGLGRLVYTSPIAAQGVAVTCSGFMGPPMAVKLGGSGDVTATHRLWREERSSQQIGSGIIHQGHFYRLDDRGIAECRELESGKRVWRQRLGTRSWSSLVLSGDRLYTADHGGNFFVIRAAPQFEQLAHNELGERTLSSIAVSNGELFIRTHERLWCIGKAEKAATD